MQAINSLVVPLSSPLHFPPGISDSDQLLHRSSEVHLMGSEVYEELPRDLALCALPPVLWELKDMAEHIIWSKRHEVKLILNELHAPKLVQRRLFVQSKLTITKMSVLCH